MCVPEPGMPETAIIRRFDGEMAWNFSIDFRLVYGWNSMGACLHTPGLLDQAVNLFLHGYVVACE